jgi:hypothetical protein
MTVQRFTIPGGHDFSNATSESVAFFAWLAQNHVDPAKINPAADVVVSTTNGLWGITAVTTDGESGTWPLSQPTETITKWLDAQFGGPKPVDLTDVKSRLDKLRDARKRAKDAADEADELRAEILGILVTRGGDIAMVDGAPIAQRKTIHKTRLNRKGLEQEYPTIVARYITEYDETRLEFL